MTRPTPTSRPVPAPARTRDVLWRSGTSPYTFAVAGAALALWIVVAALVPQVAPAEAAMRLGGSVWQFARLFMAHAVARSWLTWLLGTIWLLSAAGLALKHAASWHSIMPFAAVGLGLAALAAGTLPSGHGRIHLVEGASGDAAGFRAERTTPGGLIEVQLPFSLHCDLQNEAGLPCFAIFPDGQQREVSLPEPGRGVVVVKGTRLAWVDSSPAPDVAGVRLGSSTGQPASSAEILTVTGEGGHKARVSVVSTKAGSILAADDGAPALGVDLRLLPQGLRAATITAPTKKLAAISTPRWIRISYTSATTRLMWILSIILGLLAITAALCFLLTRQDQRVAAGIPRSAGESRQQSLL